MLTRLRVRNFKCLADADIELGRRVVLIGPNNSGKTAALQALALWDIGLRRWNERRKGKPVPETRPGVTINRRDLLSMPVPQANLLWRNLHVRDVQRPAGGDQTTQNVRIAVIVEGVTRGQAWECGLEFDYANDESIYCRPLRVGGGDRPPRMSVPDEAATVRTAFLPPLSGLAAEEPKWEPGRIDVLLGEGQTAQVLRNLCYQLYEREDLTPWRALCDRMRALFGVELLPPQYIVERGEITMAYRERERSDIQLDLSVSGRGLQQTLLLLAYLYAHPGTTLLLDEPDAHLEILRQRQTYQVLSDIAEEQGCQMIAASHSEVVLNEAAGRDVVIAFVGAPHRIDDRGSQVLKALRDIGFEDYYQAEQTGWVLYLEGSSHSHILRAFARLLSHPTQQYLEQPFVYTVHNQPGRALSHFHGLREAKPDLVGLAVFDRLDRDLDQPPGLAQLQWRKREIENYLCQEQVLLAYARGSDAGDLFTSAEAKTREQIMGVCIARLAEARRVLREPGPWSDDIKASDQFLTPLFAEYFERLGLANLMNKSDYHELVQYLTPEMLPDEVTEKLDRIVEVAQQARPRA